LIHDYSPNGGDQLSWKWLAGTATSKADFGTPTATTSYALCVYAGGTLVRGVTIPAGASWSENATGYRWINPAGAGVQSVFLKAGPDAIAKIQAKGKGAGVLPPGLPLALPARVQLLESDPGGVCFEAVFSLPIQNKTTLFNAKAD